MTLATTNAPLLPFLPEFVNANLGWFAFGLIVVIGLLVYGLRDVTRFSFRRTWAIGGVCFSDAVRRRVLWVAPLAMLGVLVVGQLINPTDEQDAVRQTVKFCLFATGFVVVVVTVILACTNLPREIENKVIFTVVTKPTTRLEIVLGKIFGFARVSALLLLIMGVFTAGYAYLRAWSLQGDLRAKAQSTAVDPAQAAWAAHYAQTGLLTARTVAPADGLEVYADPPADAPDSGDAGNAGAGTRWMYASTMDYVAPFALTDADLPVGVAGPPEGVAGGVPAGPPGLFIVAHVPYRALPADAAATADVPVPLAPADPATAKPAVTVSLLNQFGRSVQIPVGDGSPITLTDPTGKRPIRLPLSIESARTLAATGQFLVRVSGTRRGFLYGVGPGAVTLQVPKNPSTPNGPATVLSPVATAATPKDSPGQVRGTEGRFGMGLPAPEGARRESAVYRFTGAAAATATDAGRVPMELRAGIRRGDEGETLQDVTELAVSVRNRATGATSPEQMVYPESGRTVFFDVPAEAVKGGDFDVLMRTRTPGHTAELTPGGLELVTGRQSFAWNLFKALLATWLLSVLVAAIAVCASTFVSWPIAIVLTLIVLLGHWTVMSLSDALAPGAGRTTASDFFDPAANPAKQKVVESTLENLISVVRRVGDVLPDLGAFGAGDSLQQGEAVPPALLLRALEVLVGFGLPLVIFAYVFLRNKEVAP